MADADERIVNDCFRVEQNRIPMVTNLIFILSIKQSRYHIRSTKDFECSAFLAEWKPNLQENFVPGKPFLSRAYLSRT